jgi:hypothetical protein
MSKTMEVAQLQVEHIFYWNCIHQYQCFFCVYTTSIMDIPTKKKVRQKLFTSCCMTSQRFLLYKFASPTSPFVSLWRYPEKLPNPMIVAMYLCWRKKMSGTYSELQVEHGSIRSKQNIAGLADVIGSDWWVGRSPPTRANTLAIRRLRGLPYIMKRVL